jgi:hypothetical protein
MILSLSLFDVSALDIYKLYFCLKQTQKGNIIVFSKLSIFSLQGIKIHLFVKAKHVTRKIKVETRIPKEAFVGTGLSKDLFLPFLLFIV